MKATTTLPVAAAKLAAILLLLFHFAAGCSMTGARLTRRGGGKLNGTRASLQPRWSHMVPRPDHDVTMGGGSNGGSDSGSDVDPPDPNPGGQLWPNYNIVYCFADDDHWSDFTTMEYYVFAAWQLWVFAGVNDQILKFRQGNNVECDENAPGGLQDGQILIIDRSPTPTDAGTGSGSGSDSGSEPDDEGAEHSDVGYQFGNGQRMALTDPGNVPVGVELDDAIRVIAHEIGHVWGLYHEHSRNNLWDSTYQGGTGIAGDPLGIKFNCHNVKGWADAVDGMSAANQDKICHQYLANSDPTIKNGDGVEVVDLGLELTDWLPLPDATWQQAGPVGAPIDLTSIMLYASDAGSAAGGGPVITLNGGGLLAENTTPSPLDVQGLMDLYPPVQPLSQPSLLGDASNPLNAAFRSYQQAAAGGSCPPGGVPPTRF
ncbi:hypothetical protein B0H63DRAFT_558329 [Podospora didyma]|uniref:Peptidase metallopeptidase domain-containing protein n=1 Tax=Podospora didyma TaxID=330526 RepID=A0AAE0NS45_9PEZI|nr:hypothetical protein B0H63DRAFT_558329 [Podospora didyma]